MSETENNSHQEKCETAFEIPCDLGEGPVWDNENKRILWIDITKGEIHSFFPESGKHNQYKTQHMIGAITLTESGKILAALQSGFALIDLENSTMQPIIDPEDHLPDNRFNDGKCDPAGRFWAGTMSMSGKEKAGSLYSLENDLTISAKIEQVSVSNGLAWSPDNTTFYFIDTATKQVAAYDYDTRSGAIKNQRIVIEMTEEEGYPDGMTIDTEGMLWIAFWDGWKVGRFNPATGKMISSIPLPVSRPTSCVFGGDSLQDLYITTARYTLSEADLIDQPLAGSLFVFKNSGYQGLPATKFKL